MKFITTFHKNDYETMGKKLFDAWKNMKNMNLLVLLEDPSIIKNEDIPKNIIVKEFNDPDHRNFVEKWKNFSKEKSIIDGRYEYRFDVTRFCHKIFAINYGMKFLTDKDDLYIWWDADAFPVKPVTKNFIKTKLSPLDYIAAYLGRVDVDHSETGFIAFNMKHPLTKEFIQNLKYIYTSEQIFKNPTGWTDCHVFDIVRGIYEKERNAKFLNISKGVRGTDVWPHTWLAEFSKHYKGFKRKLQKGLITDKFKELQEETKERNIGGNMQRYQQIYRIIDHFKPQVIAEIGVAQGDRAIEMVKTALKHHDTVVYFGFDLFEDLTPEISEREFNAKKVPPMRVVNDRLLEIQKEHPGFFFALFKGDTREILKEVIDKPIELANQKGEVITAKPSDANMIFIDGGHSVETIKNDYEHFKNTPLIIFDDFYVPDENGRCPDTTKFGCNFLLNEVPHAKLLPVEDYIVNGGKVKLMVGGELAKYIQVEEPPQNQPKNNERGKEISPAGVKLGDKNIKIQTRNAVKDEEIQQHVDYACRLMKRFNIPEVPVGDINDNWAVTIGGSPSFKEKENMELLKEFSQRDDHVLFTSKTAHDYLIENDIIPWGCILLDPRPHVAKSFTVHPDIVYIVASQCHPDVFDYLLDNNAKMMVYHAAVAAGEVDVIKKHFPNATIIAGGSTSQTRGLVALLYMGFWKFKMFGIDSSYPERPQEVHGINKKKEPFEISVKDERTGENIGSYWVDAELLAQVNDMDHLLKSFPFLKIELYGKGLMKTMFGIWKKEKLNFSKNYENYVDFWKKELEVRKEMVEKRNRNMNKKI